MEAGEVSSGIPALDMIIQGLRPGDNVVFQVERLSDYCFFTEPFVERSLAHGKDCVYIRFANHPPVVGERPGVHVEEVDPGQGFDYFSRVLHSIVEERGRGVFYVLDNLSNLAVEWATDELLANFFLVTCPFMFEMECIAYFALTRGRHAHATIARIRDTTQILVDVYRVDQRMYVHPLKVWDRYSPEMFLPHSVDRDGWHTIAESGEAAAVSLNAGTNPLQPNTGSLAPWDSVYQKLLICTSTMARDDPEVLALSRELGRMIIGGHPDFADLLDANFDLADILDVRGRMVGSGRIGGKAAGMLLARKILTRTGTYEGVDFREVIEDHDSFYIGSDVFFTFLVENDLFRLRLQMTSDSDISDEEFEDVEKRFSNGRFPAYVLEQFRDILDYFGQAPVIIRSSSLLEDSFGNAFAGKYRSEFCANQGTPEQRLEAFTRAVKLVYASALNPDALAYRRKRGLGVSDEQMAILVQRVSGFPYRHYFFPSMAGVGFSRNLYAWCDRIDPREGVIRLVFGLGTRAVDRVASDYPRMIALSHPELRPEDESRVSKYSQHLVDLIDLKENKFTTVPVDCVLSPEYPQLPLLISIEEDGCLLDYIGSYLPEKHGRLILTFNNLVRRTYFVKVIRAIMHCLEEGYDCPVDIEFTASVDRTGRVRVNLLQCRPLFVSGEAGVGIIPGTIEPQRVLFRSSRMINAGRKDGIRYILLIDPEKYSSVRDDQIRRGVGRIVGRLNRHPMVVTGGIVMMGPGRWGSSNLYLGVNARYGEIDNAVALVELAREEAGQVPEVSYGTHFFQDLVEAEIVYMPVWPEDPASEYNAEFFDNAPSVLQELLPDVSDYKEIMKVIDIPAVTGGKKGVVVADPRRREAVMFVEG